MHKSSSDLTGTLLEEAQEGITLQRIGEATESFPSTLLGSQLGLWNERQINVRNTNTFINTGTVHVTCGHAQLELG